MIDKRLIWLKFLIRKTGSDVREYGATTITIS